MDHAGFQTFPQNKVSRTIIQEPHVLTARVTWCLVDT